MRTKGIGPNNLGVSPLKVTGGPGGKGKKSVTPEAMTEKQMDDRSNANAFMDSLREGRAKKAEESGDTGRAQRIRSTKNTQSNVG